MLRRLAVLRIYDKKGYAKIERTKARKVEKTISFAGRSTYIHCELKHGSNLRTPGRGSQLAVTGLGRERPTLCLPNNATESARALIVRYAGRNRVEDGLGISVNFLHVDCVASEVRLNVDLDTRGVYW
jgi:hypothetical protein